MYVLEVMSGPLDGKTWSFEREITIGRDDAVAGASRLDQGQVTGVQGAHGRDERQRAGQPARRLRRFRGGSKGLHLSL